MELQGNRETVAEPFIDMAGYWKHMRIVVISVMLNSASRERERDV